MKREEEEEETVDDKGQVEDQVELLASSITATYVMLLSSHMI